MTRTKPQTPEEVAQAECSKMFNLLGWALKTTQGAWCDNCSTFIRPMHTGAVDTLALVRGQDGPIPVGVEVKAAEDIRWAYNTWDAPQQRWAEAWMSRIGASEGSTWLWLSMGTASINAVDPYRRCTWLVPQSVMLGVIQRLQDVAIENLPMNLLAAQTRIITRNPLDPLHAEALIDQWKLTRVTSLSLWWPSVDHGFWDEIGTGYVTPEDASDYTSRHPHPDKYAVETIGGDGRAGATKRTRKAVRRSTRP